MNITVTREKEQFKPIILSIEIQNEDELIALYNRFNLSHYDLVSCLGKHYCECDEEIAKNTALDIFSNIDCYYNI